MRDRYVRAFYERDGIGESVDAPNEGSVGDLRRRHRAVREHVGAYCAVCQRVPGHGAVCQGAVRYGPFCQRAARYGSGCNRIAPYGSVCERIARYGSVSQRGAGHSPIRERDTIYGTVRHAGCFQGVRHTGQSEARGHLRVAGDLQSEKPVRTTVENGSGKGFDTSEQYIEEPVRYVNGLGLCPQRCTALGHVVKRKGDVKRPVGRLIIVGKPSLIVDDRGDLGLDGTRKKKHADGSESPGLTDGHCLPSVGSRNGIR